MVVAGRLWGQVRAVRAEGAEVLSRLLAVACERCSAVGLAPVNHDTVDETNILNRWLYQYAGHPAILPLPTPPSAPDWGTVAVRALALTDEDLAFDERPDEGDAVGAEAVEALDAVDPLPSDASDVTAWSGV